MIPRSFAYHRPASLDEAVALLASEPGARALAGGQSLVNALKLRVVEVSALVDVSRLAELRGVRVGPDGTVEIGAAMTYDELACDEGLRRATPIVAKVADKLVDQQVRCRGTIGGNCCFNDPASNYPPLLVAVGATLRVTTPESEFDMPAEEFFVGPYVTAAGGGAVLRAVAIPMLAADERVGYQTVQIAEDSWALARAAVWVKGDSVVEDVRIVLGCQANGLLRARSVEQAVIRAPLGPGTAAGAREALGQVELQTVSDAHGSDEYRRMLAGVVVERALREAMSCDEGVPV